MAEIASWQRQNMKKSGAASGPCSMHEKLGGAKPLKMADGGDVEEARLKQEGLKASADEKVGFFERLRMGNIDEPGSEAYNRFGAGRAKGDAAQTERENAVMDRKAEANRPAPAADTSLPSDDMRAGMTEPAAPKMTADDLRKSEKDTTPVKTAARPVKPNPAKKPAPVGGGRTTMANDPRIVKNDAPAPAADPKAPMAASERYKKNREDFDNVPLVRAGRAVADFFGGADKRYLQSKMGRGESLTETEKAQARRAGLM